MYTTRVLTPAEWDRVAGMPVGALVPHATPERMRIVTVEAEGTIVASLALLNVVTVECPWIIPSHRRSPAVGRALLRAIAREVQAWGAPTVLIETTQPQIARWMTKLGAIFLPAQWWVWRTKESRYGNGNRLCDQRIGHGRRASGLSQDGEVCDPRGDHGLDQSQ